VTAYPSLIPAYRERLVRALAAALYAARFHNDSTVRAELDAAITALHRLEMLHDLELIETATPEPAESEPYRIGGTD
jgi:hypothetical protein